MSTVPADVALLTRFNLPSEGVEELIRAEEGWLRDRVALFERHCLPSVRSQSSAGASWIVYFDPQSPAWLTERIATWQDVLTPVYRARVSTAELLADLRRVTGAQAARVITANLDNDDALATDFVARLRAAEPVAAPCALYVTWGLILAGDRTYLRRDPRNAFCAVSAPWGAPVTCWSEWHNRLERVMPVQQVGGPPGWLQVVHGRNVSNRTRGRLVSPAPYRDRFPGQLDAAHEPEAREVLLDRVLLSPGRHVRDAGRAGLRRALVAALGRDGFDRLKAVGARAGHRAVASHSEAQPPPS